MRPKPTTPRGAVVGECCPDEKDGYKNALCSVYVKMRFLDSHVERARQNIKEMGSLWDTERVLQYYQEQLDYIDYCVKDLSGKIMKYIQEGDFK